MAKKNSYANAVYLAQQRKLRECALISRMQTLDKVTIALGQLGYSPDDIAKFEDEFVEVEKEYCDEVIDDAKDDKSITYAKDKIDRILKQYVREDRFSPYDERFNVMKMN